MPYYFLQILQTAVQLLPSSITLGRHLQPYVDGCSDRNGKNRQYVDKHESVKCHPNLLTLPKILVIAKTVPEPLIFRLLLHRAVT